MNDLETMWADPNHDAWFGLGARLAAFVHEVAGRRDLIMRVSPAPQPAPACFVPALAEVRFSATELFDPRIDDPSVIDPMLPEHRTVYPHLLGVACHEAAHAAFSRLTWPQQGDPAAIRWATVLEEPRIEGRLVATARKYRMWLRASSERFDFGENPTDAAAAVQAAVLVVGRAKAGVLTDSEVDLVRSVVVAILGAEVWAEVDAVIDAALDSADGDVDTMMELGARLAALDDEGTPAPDSDASCESETDTAGPNSSATQMPCGSWTQGDIPDGVDPYDAAPPSPPPLEALRSAIAVTAADVAAAVADETNPAATTPHPLTGSDAADLQTFGPGITGSTIVVQSMPVDTHTRDETRALIAKLRRADYHGTRRVRIGSMTPPGRLNAARLQQQQAQLALGRRPSAHPWAATVRRTIENPRLIVGISSDVSGSMEPYQRGAARLTYALGHAVRYCGGEVAGVAWNHDVTVTARPGERPTQVREAICEGGSSGCATSLQALNGALHLTRRREAVRVVVVITDGAISCYDDANTELGLLSRAGVHVLWVTPARDERVSPSVTNLIMAPPQDGGAAFGRKLGTAIADLLRGSA